ncbi:MAG: glycoside hydrolase family 38 C-terminal domain-containing protein [Thermogutta sp.]
MYIARERRITALALQVGLLAVTVGTLGAASTSASLAMARQPAEVLWRIGTRDNNSAEFSQAPNQFSQYKEDPVFIVGLSDPAKDWPYAHPGPADVWAGSRVHVATILFAMDDRPAGEYRLVLDFTDTHDRAPPILRVGINGTEVFRQKLPAGGPDDTIMGDASKGKECVIEVPISQDLLKQGSNILTLEGEQGSWFLYDGIEMLAPAGASLGQVRDTVFVRSVRALPVLVKSGEDLAQGVQVATLATDAREVTAWLDGRQVWRGTIEPGSQEIVVPVPRVDQPTEAAFLVKEGERVMVERKITLVPVRPWVVYLLPHSHVDIGYTEVQTKVERDQWHFIDLAIEAAARSADYPPDARFKWNVEVLWAVDSYLRQADDAKKEAFLNAVREGVIGLDALYGNELTALCRPEELVRLVDFAERLSRDYGLTIDSAMISDVPGYTWGLMSVFGQAGVKYFSIGPNGGHRIGHTLRVWGDRAFRWLSPDGKHGVLCWIPRRGYWRGFLGGDQLLDYLSDLQNSDYPYDLVQLRHCMGDNAPPDVAVSDFVKEWNTRFAYPRLVISTCSQMMRDFEARYGDSIPTVSGDFTPYWEDGAASSALETAMNRDSAERLSQAEALWAVLNPKAYPDEHFYQAWRNVVLYDEHTWGAHNSITEPDSDFAQSQWAIKRQFAVDGDRQSRELLSAAVQGLSAESSPSAVEVFNSCGWDRSGPVTLDAAGPTDVAVYDESGKAVPSARLADGRLLFWADAVPAFGSRRFLLKSGPPAEAELSADQVARAEGLTLQNGVLTVEVDPATGGVAKLVHRPTGHDVVDRAGGQALADFFYVAGRDPAAAQRAEGGVEVRVLETGPLVASLEVRSPAPGCRSLTRVYRLFAGGDALQVTVIPDKEKVRTPEGVHVAFPFQVPDAVLRLDTAWAVVRPETDQLPGACKNYYTLQRWADLSNERFGVTWVTVHAPLVEIGAIRTDVPKPFDPSGWLESIEPSGTLYSYVMNNYWETNYKADQEGPTPFVYMVRPHAGGYDGQAAAKLGIEASRPLLPVVVRPDVPTGFALPFRIQAEGAVIETLKPVRRGEGWIVRLFNPGENPAEVAVEFAPGKTGRVWLSNIAEAPLQPVTGPSTLPPQGMLTLRIELTE